jgi:endo-1,4-beta-D-glucanase Y
MGKRLILADDTGLCQAAALTVTYHIPRVVPAIALGAPEPEWKRSLADNEIGVCVFALKLNF